MTSLSFFRPSKGPKQRPKYPPMNQRVEAGCYHVADAVNWYPPVMLNGDTIRSKLLSHDYVAEAIALYEKLTPDAYTRYLLDYYKTGKQRFGDHWRYADIVIVLLALTDVLRPVSYLEIGVRRGRSSCAVASRAPECDLYLFDLWNGQPYAGMENPGPPFVEQELNRIGHHGKRTFVVGDSHQTVRPFLVQNPNVALDLITVDGDHSYDGAVADLCDVLPRLKVGGAVVFDDLCHPQHLYLREVWKALVEDDPRYSTCTIDDVGYGVGFGVRLW